jgi:hypothetical protein
MSGVQILGKDELRNCRAIFTCECGLTWMHRIDEAIFDFVACPGCTKSKQFSELINVEYDYR